MSTNMNQVVVIAQARPQSAYRRRVTARKWHLRTEGAFFVKVATVLIVVLTQLLTFGLCGAKEVEVRNASPDLAVPRIHMTLEGPMAARLDGIIRNWLIPAPDANPGMLEMMRLRDRKPPYEDPVPWAGEFVGKYLTSCVLACRLSDDKALRDVTARVMRELIQTQADDGYLGPFPDKHLLDRWDLWGHYHCMLAMYLWHQDTGDAEALQAAVPRRGPDVSRPSWTPASGSTTPARTR